MSEPAKLSRSADLESARKDGPPPARARRPRWFRILQGGISGAITVVFLSAILAEERQVQTWEIFRGVDAGGVAAFVVLSTIGVFVRALRAQTMLRTLLPARELPSTPTMFWITAIRNALVDLVPARLGEGGYIYFLRRAGVPVSTGVSLFGFSILLDVFVLAGLLIPILCVPALHSTFATTPDVSFLGSTVTHHSAVAALIVTLFATFVLCLSKLPAGIRILGRAASHQAARRERMREVRIHGGKASNQLERGLIWLAAQLSHLAGEFELLQGHRVLSMLVAQTVALRVLKYSALWILLLSVITPHGVAPESVNPAMSLVAFVLAEASASLPISGLMGFGAYEGSLALVLSFSHVNIPSLLPVSFVVHLITQIKAYSLAVLAMLVITMNCAPRK